MMKRGENGVTLIELVVVMSIIAIMGVCLAPAIGEWLENFRIRQAAREVSSDLQFARMKAISTGRFCTILFNNNVGSTQFDYIIFPDYDNDRVLDSIDVGDLDGDGDQENETTDIFKMVRFSDGYRHICFDASKSSADGIGDGITFTTNKVAFNNQGFPSTGLGGTVYLKNTKNNKGYKVVVASTGRIRIEEYQP
jgi:prepilin-type N-terminal cleavage/methylation domain-containing protein